MKSLLREPLIHFLLIGVALFLLFEILDNPVGPQANRVVITSGQVEFLKARFAKTWQRQPTGEELQELIKGHVREEILYREALALGLDKNDMVVRRRMTQKLELMSEDIAGITVPTDDDLRKYMEEHSESFRIEPKAAFRHVFVNIEERGERADDEASRLLAVLSDKGNVTDPDALGDRFMLPGSYNLSPFSEITKLFGEQFSRELFKSKPGHWAGPILSGYGLHLVKVTEHVPGRMPELDEVRKAVEWEWTAAHRKTLKENIYKEIKEKYTVEFEQPPSGAVNKNAVSVAQADKEERQ
jgi:hypothetical protein